MLRALRAFLADHHLDELSSVSPLLSRSREMIEAKLPDDQPFAPLTPEHMTRIVERFSAANHDFVRDYLGGAARGLV